MPPSPYLTEQHKLVSSTPIKRSLTPRRRAREYALQGIYQWLMISKSGGLPATNGRTCLHDDWCIRTQVRSIHSL